MTDISFPQLIETIRATQGAYHKLTIIAGASRSGKTRLLNQVATQLQLPGINLSLLLSQRLLSQTRHQHAFKAEEIAIEGYVIGFLLCRPGADFRFLRLILESRNSVQRSQKMYQPGSS